MTDVVFVFDVEDVVHPESDDAALQLCRIFTEEEVPVSLFIAGEKARALRRRGRFDVIEAMRPHEICFHGNYWGDFPEPALHYGTDLSWDDAVSYALSVELPGLHDVADITGQFPVAWCCHQEQQCPPLYYAYKLAGVRCWGDGMRGWIMDWPSWPRSGCTLSSQGTCFHRVDPTKLDQLKPPCDPQADLRAVQERFEAMAQTRDFIVFAGHPVCWVTAEWALAEQAVLFRNGSPGPYPRPGHFRKMQPRSPEDQANAFEFVRRTLRWLKTLPGVNLTNYASLCDRNEEAPVRWLTWEQTVTLARAVRASFNYVAASDTSFSCADIAGLLCFALQYCWEYGKWPDRLPVQRLLGPTEQPLHHSAPLTISREDLFAGALASYEIMTDQRRLKGQLRASFTDLGPAELLHAAAEFIIQSADTGNLPLAVTIPPVPMLPSCVDEPAIAERRFGSTSRRAGLDFTHLFDLMKWQSWSYRPPAPR